MKFLTQTHVTEILLLASAFSLAQSFPVAAQQSGDVSVVSSDMQDRFGDSRQSPDLNITSPTFPCQEKSSDLYEPVSTCQLSN